MFRNCLLNINPRSIPIWQNRTRGLRSWPPEIVTRKRNKILKYSSHQIFYSNIFIKIYYQELVIFLYCPKFQEGSKPAKILTDNQENQNHQWPFLQNISMSKIQNKLQLSKFYYKFDFKNGSQLHANDWLSIKVSNFLSKARWGIRQK